jgi:hypothetical protein
MSAPAPKYFKIKVYEDDESGMDFNALVDVPAHLRAYHRYDKDVLTRYKFNKENRTITGCMIAANMAIERFSQELGLHYVIFDPETIDLMNRKFARNNFSNNVNLMHDSNKVVTGIVQTERFIASNSDDKKPNIPQIFDGQKIADGSLFCTYYIESDDLLSEIESGKYQGFSIEGYLDKVEINVKRTFQNSKPINKIKMSKPNFWEKLRSAFSEDGGDGSNETFTEATAADGVVVFYEGELAEGTVVMIEADGVKIPAKEGDHVLTLADGTQMTVTLDATGTVTALAAVEAPAEMDSEFVAEFMKQADKRFTDLEKESKATYAALQKELAETKSELSTWKEGGKFKKNLKADEGSQKDKAGFKKLLDKTK